MKLRGACVVVVTVTAACGGSEAPAPVTTLHLTTDGALGYGAPIELGGQAFAAKLDMGTASTAVAASACGAGCAGVSPLYAPSATMIDRHEPARADRARATWSGDVVEDAMALGEVDAPLDFVAVSAQAGAFDGNAFQAILGLGPDELLVPGTTGVMSQLAEPTVAIQLCPDHGQMWLGGFEPAGAAAPGVPAQVAAMRPRSAARPQYAVGVSTLAIGGAAIADAAAVGDAVVDVGTARSLLPAPVVDALLAQVNASPGFRALFPGQTLGGGAASCVAGATVTTEQVDAALPELAIGFGGVALPAQPTRSYLTAAGDGRFCFAIDRGGDAPGAILGASLLRAFVTIVDAGAQTISFQPETDCI
jgi:hypothetical protein|nr:pepsin-like aspartyl protease [Kofleriaceae bacterium]